MGAIKMSDEPTADDEATMTAAIPRPSMKEKAEDLFKQIQIEGSSLADSVLQAKAKVLSQAAAMSSAKKRDSSAGNNLNDADENEASSNQEKNGETTVAGREEQEEKTGKAIKVLEDVRFTIEKAVKDIADKEEREKIIDAVKDYLLPKRSWQISRTRIAKRTAPATKETRRRVPRRLRRP